MSGTEITSLVVELVCGVAIGAILMNVLQDAINPIIVFVIIIATIIAILDFADYMPAFSIAYFTGYVVEFLHSFAGIFDGLEIPVLVIALIGIGAVVAMKARRKRDRKTL
ncbi:MAG: hypothetical protein ACM3X8_00625 [Methanomicrobiales archaeon]